MTVEVDGTFAAPGAAASGVRYRARVGGSASADELRELMRHTDTVAEIQNSLRQAVEVVLSDVEVEPV